MVEVSNGRLKALKRELGLEVEEDKKEEEKKPKLILETWDGKKLHWEEMDLGKLDLTKGLEKILEEIEKTQAKRPNTATARWRRPDGEWEEIEVPITPTIVLPPVEIPKAPEPYYEVFTTDCTSYPTTFTDFKTVTGAINSGNSYTMNDTVSRSSGDTWTLNLDVSFR